LIDPLIFSLNRMKPFLGNKICKINNFIASHKS
jgi:hypothetical protein